MGAVPESWRVALESVVAASTDAEVLDAEALSVEEVLEALSVVEVVVEVVAVVVVEDVELVGTTIFQSREPEASR
jgi:hypothetical protein